MTKEVMEIHFKIPKGNKNCKDCKAFIQLLEDISKHCRCVSECCGHCYDRDDYEDSCWACYGLCVVCKCIPPKE